MKEEMVSQLKRDICNAFFNGRKQISISFIFIQPENNEIAQVQFTVQSSMEEIICFQGKAGYINNRLFMIMEILESVSARDKHENPGFQDAIANVMY